MATPESVLGRYLLEEMLHVGPFGRVWRAVDPDGFRLAVKIYDLEPEGTAEERAAWGARILREASTASRVRHELVVATHETGLTADGRPIIVRDFIVGESLSAFVADSRPALLPRKAKWLLDYARVLAHVHRAGALHRGVKPRNAMVRRDGALRVLGFGVAHRSVDRAAGVVTPSAHLLDRAPAAPTVTGAAYLAPEQLAHQAVGPAADQFAWGVTAFELLTGQLPWPASSKAVRVVEAVLTRDPAPLRTLRPDLSPEWEAIVRRCLQKAEQDRFPSMVEVVAALESSALS